VAAKGRIEVQCPHCGNIQSEPELARSTYCKKCSGYIQLGKGPRTGEPQQESQQTPSLVAKLEGMLGIQRTVIARCFECTGKREVPKSATSTICPLCGAYIDLQDYKIVGNYSRSIRTRGMLLITPKGDLNSNRVICESAEIQGHMRGSMTCAGDVNIRMQGKLSGTIDAKRIIVDKKSSVELVRPIRADLIEVFGTASARIIGTRLVQVRKNGFLRGLVHARSFDVEKGGRFLGDLTIGNPELKQGELIDANGLPTEGHGELESTGTETSLPRND
jgi:cytoskeletal protein CcmA (bactofilin family)/predicted RNA-binding Zn-ribbon protein involved in translation (DUF1610 family)